MIIGINGVIGSGKDTVGKIIQDLTSPISKDYVYLKDDQLVGAHGSSSWQIKKFASKLKQIASILTGISVEKFEDQEFKKTYLPKEWGRTLIDGDRVSGTIPLSVREFLQKLGTEAVRDNIHTNAWVNALFADYQPKEEYGWNLHVDPPEKKFSHIEYPDWVITDCRFPNEANAIKDRRGKIVRINRGEKPDYITLEEFAAKTARHPSETSLDSWVFDYTINNNGTIEELTGKVKKMLKVFNIEDYQN